MRGWRRGRLRTTTRRGAISWSCLPIALIDCGGSKLAIAGRPRVATEGFVFGLIFHSGLKHERRGCSMPHSETRWEYRLTHAFGLLVLQRLLPQSNRKPFGTADAVALKLNRRKQREQRFVSPFPPFAPVNLSVSNIVERLRVRPADQEPPRVAITEVF